MKSKLRATKRMYSNSIVIQRTKEENPDRIEETEGKKKERERKPCEK
jgi:hypothetical protein